MKKVKKIAWMDVVIPRLGLAMTGILCILFATAIIQHITGETKQMKDPKTCTHTREVAGYWHDRPDFDREEYELGGFELDESEWIDGGVESTTNDIDLHRYQCTQCNKMFYYSGRAAEHFEKGKSFNINGLE